MSSHHIRKGFDIRIAGKPAANVADAPEPRIVALDPHEFPTVKGKVLVEEGDTVETGTPLMLDKLDRDVQFLSPATGRVRRVVYGERKSPQRIEIEVAGPDRHASIATLDLQRLATTDRADLILAIKRAGLWPLLRQRPIGRMVKGDVIPTAIYVNGMDTEPLAADPAFAVAGQGTDLQLGVQLLKRLTSGPVRLTVRGGAPRPKEFTDLQGVEVHEFHGPHPAGLVGTHIARIAPLKAVETVWYLKAQEAVLLGRWLRTGQYPWQRLVAVSGSQARQPQYFRIRQGADLTVVHGGQPFDGDTRIINGTVLNGVAVDAAQATLGFYAQTVTLIPEGGDTRDLIGWMLPQIGKHSASRAVFSWLAPKQEYVLDARLHGGVRHMVNIGAMEAVLPHDIHPYPLLRSVLAGDLEEAVQLGLLELTEEDVALCTFVDPCKQEVGAIVRSGLDMYEKEG